MIKKTTNQAVKEPGRLRLNLMAKEFGAAALRSKMVPTGRVSGVQLRFRNPLITLSFNPSKEMTTTKKPVSRKSGRIALSCALLALMFLSGCDRNKKAEFEQSIKECHQKGGTAIVVQGYYDTIFPWSEFSCTLPPPSASGAKAASKDADTDGDGIPNVSDPDSLGLTSPSASGAKK